MHPESARTAVGLRTLFGPPEYYAREIRTALENLSNDERTGLLSHTVVGERIQHLVAYVDFVRQAPREELGYVKRWS